MRRLGAQLGHVIGERLDAQLKQQALTGQEEQQQDQDQSWFYAESQKRDARSQWRIVICE